MREANWNQRARIMAAGAALAAVLLFPGIAGAKQSTMTRPTNSNSVMGIRTPALGSGGLKQFPTPQASPPTPVQNFYGDNSAGTFSNTDKGAGPTDNRVSYGQNAARVISNPNNTVASETGAVANGTGQPLVDVGSEKTLSTPVEQTGVADNPQESGNALIWIFVGIFVLIGSIIGAIRISQPGGQL